MTFETPAHPTGADWERWERLIEEQGVVISQPAGTPHPRYEDMLYEYDYGYIPGGAPLTVKRLMCFGVVMQPGW